MMTGARWLIAASLAAGLCAAPLRAQEAASSAPAAEAAALTAEALDTLVAPVALYPDALLAQVLVAATYPLDVMKAARWTAANAAAAGDARADAAEAEGWDASVTVLAAGFPSVIERMADEIEWTEALGDAVIAQTDDVMDAVQRQRGRAAALGNLESNAAQTVTQEEGAISVAPADPKVVYVPAYDPALAYTQSSSTAAVVVTDPADAGYSSGELLATGVIAFGAGMLVNELFDDNDDWGGGYWYGPPRFDWNDRGFYPRPGVDIGGDVNINVDRDRIDLDRGQRFRPDDDRMAEARDRIAQREGGGALRDRVAAEGGADRAAARERIAARRDDGARPTRPTDGGNRAAAADRLRERGDGNGAALRRDGDGPLAARRAESRGTASQGGGPRAAAESRGGGALHRPVGDRPRAGGGDRPRPKAGGGGRGEAMQRGGGRDHAARAGDRGGARRR